jgi:DNA-directed RNA polymerase subunit RPC12/RpoP
MEVLMNYLKEKVAYLKGLAEGMQLDYTTNEGKLFKAIMEVLDDMALAVDDIEEVQEQLSEQVDEMDEDLAEIESLIYDLDNDDDYDDDDEDEDEDDDEDEDEDEDDEYEEEVFAEFDCPHCGETVNLQDAFMKKDTVLCPHCNKEIEIEWSCECEDCRECGDDPEE